VTAKIKRTRLPTEKPNPRLKKLLSGFYLRGRTRRAFSKILREGRSFLYGGSSLKEGEGGNREELSQKGKRKSRSFL